MEYTELKKYKRFVLPVHFYSPIPSLDEIKKDEAEIFGKFPQEISAVQLREKDQLKLLNKLVTFKSVGLKNNLGKKSRSPS